MDLQNDDLFNGLMLSDMHIREIRSMTGKTYFTIKQTTRRRTFLEFIQHYYDQDNFYTTIKDYQQGQYFTSELSSPSTYEIGEQRIRWYPNGIKIVPRDLKLNPVMIAFWFQGDGDAGRGGKDDNSVKARFSTNSFTLEDVKFLMEQLMDLGIESTTHMKEQTHPIISISKASEVKKLMDMIKPFMLDCFQYKIQNPHLVKTGKGHTRSPEKQKEYYDSLDPEVKKERNHNNWLKKKDKANPERNQRYRDDAEFREICKARSNRNYKPHPKVKDSTPNCIFCNSSNVKKSGKNTYATFWVQRYYCNNCKKSFSGKEKNQI